MAHSTREHNCKEKKKSTRHSSVSRTAVPLLSRTTLVLLFPFIVSDIKLRQRSLGSLPLFVRCICGHEDSGNKSPSFCGSSHLKGRASIHWRGEEPFNVLAEVHSKQSGGLVSLSGYIHIVLVGKQTGIPIRTCLNA